MKASHALLLGLCLWMALGGTVNPLAAQERPPADVRLLRRTLAPLAGSLTNSDPKSLEAAASQDPRAALALAWRLAASSSPDPDGARRWVERAAGAGHADAQFAMGVLAADTDRDTEGELLGDFESARDWWEKASDQGHAGAALRLGDLLWDGSLDINDGAAAKVQWERAAASGLASAKRRLGLMYLRWRDGGGGGFLSDCDPEAARTWFRRAAADGDAPSVRALSHLDAWERRAQQAGRPLRQWLPERLRKLDRGVSWVIGPEGPKEGPSVEAEGDPAVRMVLAQLRELAGEGKPARASRLSESPGAVQDPALQFEVAEMLWSGLATMPPHPQRAVDWYLASARAGHAPALQRLGELWRDGAAGTPDPAEAERWFRRAAATR